MTIIYLDAEVAIRNYTATVKGSRSIVRVEFEVTEPGALGFFLADIGRAKMEIEAARKSAASQKKATRKEKTRSIGHTELLALPYFGGNEPEGVA
ncbi:hypothetical protein [Mesorhizobium sp. KR1-2]|uniref:hypothetical protein n=1 Tax=Mesorhizobium sp. KR1-2 TaxID=3156609 RepID=UPI0032B40113